MADLYECERHEILDDAEGFTELLVKAATAAGATVLGSRWRKFSPHGASGVVLIAESHLSFHTWPEFGFVCLDVFTCGDRVMPAGAMKHIMEHLAPARTRVTKLDRGTELHGVSDAG